MLDMMCVIRCPLKDLKKVIDFCADAHIKYIFLSGGEPLTYPYLIDALKYIESKGESMIPTIATNGVLLDELSFCKQLIEHGITYRYFYERDKFNSLDQCSWL